MDDKRSVLSKTAPEEILTLVRHWDEIDKSKLIGLGLDGGHEFTVKDGKIAVMRVDDIKERFESVVDLSELISFEVDFDDEVPLPYDSDGKGCLPPDTDEEQANKKIYGKSEIMKLFGFENKKSLNFLKLLFQMEYATKIGKSYIITAEELDRFLKENRGKEIAV